MEQRTPFGSEPVANATPQISKYKYDFGGRLIEETYPSGRVIRNSFEADGDLMKIESRKTTSDVFRPFVSNFSYTASGSILQMRLGNGRWETAKFNSRLQVTELGLGASAADTSIWKIAYDYGEIDPNGNIDQTKNTGNIAKQTISLAELSNPFVQTFRYDSFYRITEAKETSGSNTNWTQNWSYDRYGNRIGFAQNMNGITSNLTPSVEPNTNRFTAGQGFVYDKNGNITADVDYSQTRSFIFNGDNKQIEILRNGAIIGRYFYDGEGKRVKKKTDIEETVFVYSSGKLVAEYSTKLAENPSTNYTTTDHLGSPRVITNELGQIKSRRDFMPFGEDLGENIGDRTSALKYATTDEVRQKFTGYQKDMETALDFAEARMYNSQHGRFTAVDPLLASGKSANPQTFNRYLYVTNSPLTSTDSSGMMPEWVKDKNAPEGINRPTWISSEEFAKGGYEEWKDTTYIDTRTRDQITLDRNGPFSVEGVGEYWGWSRNGLTQGTGVYKNFREPGISFAENGALRISGSLGLQKASDELYQRAENSNSLATKFGLYVAAFCTSIPISKPELTASGRYIAPPSLQASVPTRRLPILNPHFTPAKFGSAEIRALGTSGEYSVGISGSKQRIESITGKANFRIPERLTEDSLEEVKNVGKLSFTSQIKDFHLYAQREGLQFTIHTRPTTKLSQPLKDLINDGSIIRKNIEFCEKFK